MNATLDVQRDHPWLIRAAAGLLSPDGILLFSTNYRRFKLDPGVAEEYEVTDITKKTIPPDFARNPRIHTCFHIAPATSRRSDPAARTATGPRTKPATAQTIKPAGGSGVG